MMSDVLKVVGINSKGYGMFPKMVAQDTRLTIESKGIYSYFCSYAGSGNTAFPKVSKILLDLCIGETRYQKHLKLLVIYGYIFVEQVRTEGGLFKHNIYTLNTDIIEEPPHLQNRGTVIPHLQNRGTDNRGTDKRSTDNRSTNNNSLNINSYKNNNVNRQKKNKTEKGKTEPGKYDKFYL